MNRNSVRENSQNRCLRPTPHSPKINFCAVRRSDKKPPAKTHRMIFHGGECDATTVVFPSSIARTIATIRSAWRARYFSRRLIFFRDINDLPSTAHAMKSPDTAHNVKIKYFKFNALKLNQMNFSTKLHRIQRCATEGKSANRPPRWALRWAVSGFFWPAERRRCPFLNCLPPD